MSKKLLIASKCLVAAALLFLTATGTLQAADKQKSDRKKSRAVERTRKTVQMLDDIYKTAVVLVTEHYVNDDDDLPAGTAAIALFDAIKKKGWHEVRLLDATGEPIDDANTAQDEFDREAIKQLKAGKPWYDQVSKVDGKDMLRVGTPIPVVMQKCVKCHAHYADVKKGEPIGILSYSVPIE